MKERYIKIQGEKTLSGSVKASGAKNSALPLLFSTLLAKGVHEFHNVPNLKDVSVALNILKSLGLSFHQEKDKVQITNPDSLNTSPCEESTRDMRASILCLAPLLVRSKKVNMSLPGGCVIGKRPIDLHLKGLRALGANIKIEDQFIIAEAPKGLRGSSIYFDFPTVGGTENLLLASVLAEGKTILKNVACEPEVLDLITYLNLMGARIKRIQEREFSIEGVASLKPPASYSVIPDRIEAGTLLLAGAITHGEVEVTHCNPDDLKSLTDKLTEAGCQIKTSSCSLFVKASGLLKSVNIETEVYPGFPTDLQAQFMAFMTQLNGVSFIKENIFEQRFRHVKELRKLKAQINLQDHQTASIKGPIAMEGTEVEATDLRASAGLILGGLIARGETKVFKIYHLERGYENLSRKLQSLGADIHLIN